MSRADYLAKYMSGSSAPKKKKSKKVKEHQTTIVVDAPIIDTSVSYTEEQLQEAENELAPIKVELKSSKPNKGFKRIDNGDVVRKEPAPINDVVLSEQTEQPETIYRDSSGRIIDIKERKQQFDEKKQAQKDQKSFVEVRMSETEQQMQQNATFKPVESTFEDPLALFDESSQTNTGADYTYTKGSNPVNRFNIKAGYFWDGIDRSNSFEQLKLRKMNEMKFTKIDNAITESYDLDYDL